jgi:hypothetical protein
MIGKDAGAELQVDEFSSGTPGLIGLNFSHFCSRSLSVLLKYPQVESSTKAPLGCRLDTSEEACGRSLILVSGAIVFTSTALKKHGNGNSYRNRSWRDSFVHEFG